MGTSQRRSGKGPDLEAGLLSFGKVVDGSSDVVNINAFFPRGFALPSLFDVNAYAARLPGVFVPDTTSVLRKLMSHVFN